MNNGRWTMNHRHMNFGFRISDCGFSIPQSAFRNPKSKGVTLVEVVLILAIVGILSAVVIPKYDFGISSRASVDGAAYMVASDIRYAQESAMANRVSKEIRFTSNSNSYTFYPTSSLDPSGQLQGATIGTTITFTFNSLGEPILNGGLSVTVSDGVNARTITVVNYTGKVNIT